MTRAGIRATSLGRILPRCALCSVMRVVSKRQAADKQKRATDVCCASVEACSRRGRMYARSSLK